MNVRLTLLLLSYCSDAYDRSLGERNYAVSSHPLATELCSLTSEISELEVNQNRGSRFNPVKCLEDRKKRAEERYDGAGRREGPVALKRCNHPICSIYERNKAWSEELKGPPYSDGVLKAIRRCLHFYGGRHNLGETERAALKKIVERADSALAIKTSAANTLRLRNDLVTSHTTMIQATDELDQVRALERLR